MKLMSRAVLSACLLVSTNLIAASALARSPIAPGPTEESAKAAAAVELDGWCNDPAQKVAEKITHTYRLGYEEKTDPLREVTFFIVTCAAGAYNERSVLLTVDMDKKLVLVPFVEPVLNAQEKVIGWKATNSVNSLGHVPADKSFVTFVKWRGIGDMWSSARYEIAGPDIVLREYTQDSTSDGNDNPKTIFKSSEPLNF